MEIRMRGTLLELEQLFEWPVLCKLVRVDYYKRCMVPDNEVFTVTEQDFIRIGKLPAPSEEQ